MGMRIRRIVGIRRIRSLGDKVSRCPEVWSEVRLARISVLPALLSLSKIT